MYSCWMHLFFLQNLFVSCVCEKLFVSLPIKGTKTEYMIQTVMKTDFRHIGMVIVSCTLIMSLGGCAFVERYRMGDAIATVNNQSLYQKDIDAITKTAQNQEDSARMAEAYIRQWATDILLYDKAKKQTGTKENIERLVEDYRRSLYVHEYEKQLTEQRMPKEVDSDSIQAFYDDNPERFVLRESLLQGVLLVTPVDAPMPDSLRYWLGHIEEGYYEQTEKYAYQFATGYELFTEQWQHANTILQRIPMTYADLNKAIQKEQLIERTDSSYTYLLGITRYCLEGQKMPMEYAAQEIEKILLEQRQVQFLQQEKENIYNNAIKLGYLVFKDANKK